MRIRDRTYKYYGFEEGEVKKIKLFCRSDKFTKEYQYILLNAAEMSHPYLRIFLYKSIVEKLSYEKLADIEYIPMTKKDFYGYQKLCLYHFKRMCSEK